MCRESSIKARRCTKWTLVTATATHDGAAGLAPGGLTDRPTLGGGGAAGRVTRKTTTQTAATVGWLDAGTLH